MLNVKKEGIGIFGGSFDPPHYGHVKISKIALKKLKLEKCYWIIAKKNPFKKKTFFSLKKRIVQSKNIIRNDKKIEALYLDEKVKSSRMINILNYFKKTKKQKNLYLIIGSDNLTKFHKWTSWKKIVKLAKLVVFSRRGYDIKGKRSIVVKHLKRINIIYIKNKHINISSSILRKKYLQNN